MEMLLDMVESLSRTTDPGEVMRTFSQGIARLRGPFGYISLSTRGLAPGEYRITRFYSPEEMAEVRPEEAWPPKPELPVHHGGFLGEIIREPRPALVTHNLDVRDDPVLGNDLTRYHSMMAIPLFDGGNAVNWAVLFSETPHNYDVAELEEALLRGNLVGGTVRTVLMARELRQANARIRSEIEQISRIQKSLLPEDLPDIAGLSIAAHYKVFDQAGGDYYDFLPFAHRTDGSGLGDPDSPWGILIADASGHGPAAAVVMAMVHAIVHAYPSITRGPATVLEYLNAHLCAKRIESSFVTAFFAIYDPKTRAFTYARAGHDPPLLKNPGEGGSVSRLDKIGGLPLGVLDDTKYEETSFVINPGQSVVLYTDGITDAACPGHTRFGIGGMERALTNCSGMPECVVSSITEALNSFESGVTPMDDQTIVVLRANE
jgi:phosphoserine phosphatase RsbU/P